MVYIKKVLRKIWSWITWPYYRIKDELAYRKRLKKLKSEDPFIYK